MRNMILAAMIVGLASPGLAKPSLRDVPVVDDGLFAIGMADMIRKACPEISPRVFRAFRFVQSLQKQARDLGYSDSEIDAHVDSDEEKARMRARGDLYLAERGIKNVTPAAMCALGRAEIAQDTVIGQLLRDTQ